VKNDMHPIDFSSAASLPSEGVPTPVSVAIIDYGLGNVQSVANALSLLGAEVKVSRDIDSLHAADGLVLPGVGSFGDGMANLERFGLIPHLNELVLNRKKPILGLCLGMQLFAKNSQENGSHQGLGWLDADVVRLSGKNGEQTLKVPHMGWNDVTVTRTCPVLGLPGEVKTFYFVHSYVLQCRDAELTAGVCDYGQAFPAAVQQNNIVGVQFHPEKSQKHGLNFLANFLHMLRNQAFTSGEGFKNNATPQQNNPAPPSKRETSC
jgi:glutamine amidotransferase